jgi:hypothetical protein
MKKKKKKLDAFISVKNKRKKLPHLHLLSEFLSVNSQRFLPILFLRLTTQNATITISTKIL